VWISSAADRCLPKRQSGRGKRAVPWWNQEINELRGMCLKTRRLNERKRKRFGDHNSRAFEEIWKEAKRALSLVIKIAKE